MKKLYQGHSVEHIDQYSGRDRFIEIFKIKYCPNDKEERSPRGEEENTDDNKYISKNSYKKYVWKLEHCKLIEN